jgi:hypothetical protein
MKRNLLMVLCSLFVAGIAYAGAPLKGVDVKLGKNPGGSPAARTTDASGKINFGVLPRGSYALEVMTPMPAPPAPGARMEPPMQTAFVTIEGVGAQPYKVEWNFMMHRPSPVQPPDATARAAQAGPPPDKIYFDSDGTHPVQVTIVKSKSNITNN